MHGHGEKPFLCTADNCERSLPGNGFPRHWNLRDHMKRVHNTVPEPTESEPARGGKKRKTGLAEAGVRKAQKNPQPSPKVEVKPEPVPQKTQAEIVAEERRRLAKHILETANPEEILRLSFQMREAKQPGRTRGSG
jgi:hypothetical protein